MNNASMLPIPRIPLNTEEDRAKLETLQAEKKLERDRHNYVPEQGWLNEPRG